MFINSYEKTLSRPVYRSLKGTVIRDMPLTQYEYFTFTTVFCNYYKKRYSDSTNYTEPFLK